MEKEAELKRQRKREERERWWSGAEAYFPKDKYHQSSQDSAKNKDSEQVRTVKLGHYTADYSKWDTWVPDDEVSQQELREREAEEERRRNEIFEKSNPEFCQQFMQDMETRKKTSQKKQETADALRLKGNKYFKARDFPRALEQYVDALKSAPFDAKLLLNIAQVCVSHPFRMIRF